MSICGLPASAFIRARAAADCIGTWVLLAPVAASKGSKAAFWMMSIVEPPNPDDRSWRPLKLASCACAKDGSSEPAPTAASAAMNVRRSN